jgi:hypothetical protein
VLAHSRVCCEFDCEIRLIHVVHCDGQRGVFVYENRLIPTFPRFLCATLCTTSLYHFARYSLLALVGGLFQRGEKPRCHGFSICAMCAAYGQIVSFAAQALGSGSWDDMHKNAMSISCKCDMSVQSLSSSNAFRAIEKDDPAAVASLPIPAHLSAITADETIAGRCIVMLLGLQSRSQSWQLMVCAANGWVELMDGSARG